MRADALNEAEEDNPLSKIREHEDEEEEEEEEED